MTTPTSLTVRGLRIAAALAALTALVAGLPWLLYTVVGNPLTGLPHLSDTTITGQQIQHVVALILWPLWALFVAALAFETGSAVRGVDARRIRVLTPMHALAALLIAGLLAAPVATAAHTGPLRSTVAVSSAVTVPAVRTAVDSAPATAANTTADTAVRNVDGSQQVVFQIGVHHYIYTVHRGDTLWAISGQWLGDHERWPEIVSLNQSHYQRLRTDHGNLIEPGWMLRLPADAAPPPGAAAIAPPTHHTKHPPTTITPTPTSPSPIQQPAGTAPSTAVPTPDPGSSPPRGTATPARAAAPAASTRPVAGVQLRGHDWLDVGLATTLLAAGALVWAHRRRRYIPQPPTAARRMNDPDLAPLPADISTVRHALRTSAASEVTGTDDSGFADIAPLDDTDLDDTDLDDTDLDDTDLDDDDSTGDDTERTAAADTTQMPALVIPALTYPASTAWPPAGLGLTGPGADAAACGFLVAALADRHSDQPEERPQVVIPSASLATLLGTDAVLLGATPRLTVTGSLDDALYVLDRAVLTRTRLVRDSDSDTGDLATVRGNGFFDEPLPPLLLIADAIEHRDRARVAAVLTQGERLDIHGVLLGPWPNGSTVTVARDGATTRTQPDTSASAVDRVTDLSRLTVLEPARAADLIRVAIEADTGKRQPSATTVRATDPPAYPPPGAAESTEDSNTSLEDADTADESPLPVPSAERPGTTVPEVTTASDRETADGQDTDDIDRDNRLTADDADTDDTVADSDEGPQRVPRAVPTVRGPVRVHLFSHDVIVEDLPADSTKKPPFRVKSRDILAYLILHPGRVPDTSLSENVLSDIRMRVVRERLNTFMWCLRANLEAAAGAQPYLERPKRGGWTALVPAALDVDVWRLRDHLAAAEQATDPAARITALRAAIGEYTGPLMERIEQDWIEPFRQAYLRQVIDARSALARLLAPTDTGEALTILAEALRLNPYSEALYVQAMGLHAARGDIEGIRALRRDATGHLGDIDTEPSEELITAADRLIGEIKQRRPGGNR